MQVVSFKICPFVQRVTALLEAKQIAYEVTYIDLSNKPGWFLKASPNAQVPILITNDGDVLFESDAIVEYLDETEGEPVSSRNPVTKAQERAWSYLATKHYLVQCSAQRSPDEQTLIERRSKLDKAFGKIEAQLGGGPFFRGANLGMVDIAWMVLLHRAAVIERCSGYDFVSTFPKTKSWQKTLMATGLPEKSVSEDFAARFSNFYLADETYLGQQMKLRSGQACCGPSECKVEDLACCA